MKHAATSVTIEQLVDLMRRSRVLADAEVRAIEEGWPRETGDTADVGRFARWLVARGHLTEYQTAMLLHGHASALFLGPYKLLDRIGKGSLAVVYRAVGPTGEVVALKVLPPSRARDHQLRARFRNEAELACQLHHANVVRAVEAGEANGVHYLVLEYLPGENLREAIKHRGPLPIGDVVHIARQTLAGLQYLFEQGLVHRNLEPANLMLALPPGIDARTAPLRSATVKILDTSLSRSVFEETIPGGTGSSRLTYEGQLVGTPEYLAPEQARDAHACDSRADLYGLGCVLYHALTGAPPFQDPSPLGVVIRHAVEQPRPVAELRSDVPVVLSQMLDCLLAKDPDARFATPAEALAALPANLEAMPAARPAPTIPIAAPVEPQPTTQLPAAEIASIPISPPFDEVPDRLRARPRPASFWQAMLLGALILLFAQSAGWMLAYLLFL